MDKRNVSQRCEAQKSKKFGNSNPDTQQESWSTIQRAPAESQLRAGLSRGQIHVFDI